MWLGRSGVWERNIMTAEIISKIHHLTCWVGHVWLAGMILGFVGVLGLPYRFIIIR